MQSALPLWSCFLSGNIRPVKPLTSMSGSTWESIDRVKISLSVLCLETQLTVLSHKMVYSICIGIAYCTEKYVHIHFT